MFGVFGMFGMFGTVRDVRVRDVRECSGRARAEWLLEPLRAGSPEEFVTLSNVFGCNSNYPLSHSRHHEAARVGFEKTPYYYQ